MALGAERFEGNGSRIRFLLNGIKATFHRPHPQKETDKGAVNQYDVFWKKEVYNHDAIQRVFRQGRV